MSHLSNAKSKFDVLQKYLAPASGSKKVKPNSIPQNQLRVVDKELEGFDRGFQNGNDDENDEDAPLVVETPDSVKIDFNLKAQAIKGKLGNIAINKPFQQPKTSGKWVSVTLNKPAEAQPTKATEIKANKEESESSGSESSDDERRRKRHDTESEGGGEDSEDEDDKDEEDKDMRKLKRDMRTALGVGKEKKEEDQDNKIQQEEDDDEDLDVVRKNDTAPERKVGGLKTVQELKVEGALDKGKQDMLNKLAEQYKNSETIYRDKEGKRINIFKDLATKKQEKLKKNEDRIKEWSAGVVQKKEIDTRKKNLQTANEDFSKTGITKEYDTQLMEKRRFGDTMAPVIEKPKVEKEKKQMPKIRCKFTGVPNRFGIEPGRMWDGVDRGAEYETRLMAKINESKDKEEMARTWAMQEM